MNGNVYADLLAQSLKTHAALPCLHIKRSGAYVSWTYGKFHQDLNRLFSVLTKIGLKKGTTGIVIGENSPEWIIAYHAIMLTGACTVPIDPNIPASEIESIVTATKPRVVFCSGVYLNLFRKFKKIYGFIEKIVLLETATDQKEPLFNQFIADGNKSADAFAGPFDPEDPMVIIFTSGTTGKAKGVVLCQRNFTSVCLHAIPRMKIGKEDIVCAVLPLHHVFGCAAGMVAPLYSGMGIVCVPYIKAPLILEALNEKNVTFLPTVPKMLQLFYDGIFHKIKQKGPLVKTAFTGMSTVSAAAGDLLGENFKRALFSGVHKGFGGRLRLIISGGAALSKTYWQGFRRLGFTIVEGYGLTETFGPITVCPGEKPRLGSVGPVLPGNEMRIDSPDANGIGEVLLRGNCVFKGYYGNEALTCEVVDNEGWFHTGDLGRVDADGYLYLSGRKKDVIVLDSGKNVYPDELEDYYGTSALIEEIGIFGIEQGKNEIVAAAVVPDSSIRKTRPMKQATDMICTELMRMGKGLPAHRRISDFVVSYSALPRTTTRKLKKNELRKLYTGMKRKSEIRTAIREEMSVIELAMMETAEYIQITEEIIRIAPKNRIENITTRSHLDIDLGLDSLDRLELQSSLEKAFSITIPESVFDKMEYLSDLVSLVRDSTEKQRDASIENTLDTKERIFTDASVEAVQQPQRRRPLAAFATEIALDSFVRLNKISVHNAAELIRAPKPSIFVSNHLNRDDLIALFSAIPSAVRRRTLFLQDGKNSPTMLSLALLKPFMLAMHNCNDPIEITKVSIAAIQGKKNIVIFPEEDDSTQRETIGRFRPAVGLVCLETGATIVPVKILGISSKATSVRFGKATSVTAMMTSKLIEIDGRQPTPEAVADALRRLVTDL